MHSGGMYDHHHTAIMGHMPSCSIHASHASGGILPSCGIHTAMHLAAYAHHVGIHAAIASGGIAIIASIPPCSWRHCPSWRIHPAMSGWHIAHHVSSHITHVSRHIWISCTDQLLQKRLQGSCRLQCLLEMLQYLHPLLLVAH